MSKFNQIIDELLLEHSQTYPFPSLDDKEQIKNLMECCDKLGYSEYKDIIREFFLNEAEPPKPKVQPGKEGESKDFPGKFHLGGGYYSSQQGGGAEFKNDNGNLRPVTPEEKAEFEKKSQSSSDSEKKSQSSSDSEKKPPINRSVGMGYAKKKLVDVPKQKLQQINQKIENWSEKEKEFFNKGQDNPGSETRRSFAEALRDKVKGAGAAIKHGFQHEVELFKHAAGAASKLFKREKLDKEDKKALIKVGIKIATTALGTAALGGVGGGIGAFAKHVAVEFVPHVVAETIAVGAARASIFADVNENERILMDFANKIAEGLENMEMNPDIMNSIVDKWNEQRTPEEQNSEAITLDELLESIILNESEGESSEFPGKYHLGGGYYSSKDGGEAEFKNDKGNLRPVTPEEKAEFEGKGMDSSKEDELMKTAETALDDKEKEIEDENKPDPKENPEEVLNDPNATSQDRAKARAFKSSKDNLQRRIEDSGEGVIGEPVKLESANDDPNSKIQKFKGKSSGRDIQTIEFEGGGLMFGTVHRDTKMVNDIVDQIKSTIPQEKWKDIVFVGEGGATNDGGELEFHDEMNYAVPKFKQMGAEIDSWDGDDLDVHNDQSKLYKKQMEKTGLNHSQVKAGNWASMIGQGEDVDTMSPDDYLDEDSKQFIQNAAKEAGLPQIENWNDPTGEVPNEDNPEGSGDRGTLFRLAFPEDNGDTQTKINDIQVAFNDTRDENIIEKRKELVDKGKIPIVIAGEGHVELVDKMLNGVSDNKSETKKVGPEKIVDEMPKADSETFSKDGKALDGIDPQQLEQFNTDISKVSKMIEDAKANGEPAPNINLCDITIPGTNLYCDDNKGIPREEMPQFKGKAVDGSRAAGMETDKDGEVDTEPVFREMLKEKGVKVLQTEVPADKLKATQKDLVGEKVIGMMGALEKDPNHPKITAPIYVSRDGFVIDGHHRWAAIVAYNAKHPDNPIQMKSTVIDMDIKDAIPMANKFAEDMGIAAKKADDKDGELPKPKKANETPNTRVYNVGGNYYSDTPDGPAQYIKTESVVEKIFVDEDIRFFNLIFEAVVTKQDADGNSIKLTVIDTKDQPDATEKADELDSNKDGSNVTPVNGNWEDKASSQMNQPKYSNSILDDNLKKSISIIIGKITSGQDLTDEEKQIAKDYVKIVKTDAKVKIYIAAKTKGDWPQGGYVKVELGSGNDKKKWADEAAAKYGITAGQSSQGAIGKKQISPAKTNPKRKKAKIEVIDDNTIMFNGQKMAKLPVLTFDEIKDQIKSENPELTDKELNKKAAILEKRIRRYNDNIDVFKEIAQEGGGEFEYVDYGDVDTPENRGKAIQNMVDITIADFKRRLGDKADLPENKLVMDSMESLKKFEGVDLEKDEEARKEYEQILSDIIVHMTNSKDFRDGVADFAEQKVAMELLGRGYPTYLPSDEAFKTADVLVANPAELSDLSEKSNSLQLLYVTLEFSGGISVKYQGGGAGNSDEKVKKTRFKNNETRKRLNGMLGTYDSMYPNDRTPPNFPPSQETLDELNKTHEDNKKWAIENGIATEEEVKKAEEWADKRIEAVLKTFESNGVMDCMSDDEKSRFKETMRSYYRNQKLMEVIYNNDADYTMFGNSNQKIKVSKGKAVANESDVADGVEDICYMKIKDDVGFNYSKQGDCTVVKPSNRNPSEIHSHKPTIK